MNGAPSRLSTLEMVLPPTESAQSENQVRPAVPLPQSPSQSSRVPAPSVWDAVVIGQSTVARIHPREQFDAVVLSRQNAEGLPWTVVRTGSKAPTDYSCPFRRS